MYSITVHEDVGVVEAKIDGMMSVDELDAYLREFKAALIQHGLESFGLLLDIASAPVQQKQMVEALAEQMETMPRPRAMAVVTQSTLMRMQVRRLLVELSQPYVRATSTLDEGRAWLVDGIEPPAETMRSVSATD